MTRVHAKLNRLIGIIAVLALLLTLLPATAMAAGAGGASVSVDVSIPVQKIVTGDAPATAETFTFTLAAQTAGAPMPGSTTIAVVGNGTASFPGMTFDHAGEYIYTVRESDSGAANYTYDSSVYTVTVRVTNSGSGGLTALLIYQKDGLKQTSMIFRNNYLAPVVPPPANTGTLTISNTVTGGLGETNKPFTYVITLTDDQGNPLTGSFSYSGSGVPGGTITSGGSITLAHGQSVIIRDLPVGTKYTVTEVEANQNGYTTTVQGATGTITAVGNAIAWLNHRDGPGGVNPVAVILDPQKTLDGRAPVGSQFTFYLKDGDGHVLQIKQNNGSAIAFDELVFTQAGTYHYSMSEHAGTDSNIIYDGGTYTVTIAVTEKNGSLQAVTTVLKDGDPYEGRPIFANKTNPGGGSGGGGGTDKTINITLSKVWEDDGNAAGKRPGSVTVHLLRDGVQYQAITLDAVGGWQSTLTVPETGVYSVTEDAVAGYSAVITGSATAGFVVTNRFTPDKIDPDPSTDPDTNPPGANEGDNDTTNPDGTGNNGNGGISVPITGDAFRLALWIFLAVAAVGGMFLLTRRRREPDDE